MKKNKRKWKREGTKNAQKEIGEDSAAMSSKWGLSFLVCKHVRYVLEEHTKDDSWSSSFGPEQSSGPASQPAFQSTSQTNLPSCSSYCSWGLLAAPSRLHSACATSCMQAWAYIHKLHHSVFKIFGGRWLILGLCSTINSQFHVSMINNCINKS